jgi:hypothetical protein
LAHGKQISLIDNADFGCCTYKGLTKQPFLGVKTNHVEIGLWIDGAMGDWESDHNSHFIALPKKKKRKSAFFFNFFNKLWKDKRKNTRGWLRS